MDESKQRFSLGIWIIKPGKEIEFIELFRNFAKWVFDHNLGAVEVYLLQDIQQPGRFITSGPWESIQKIEDWRKLSEFKEFFSKAKELSLEVTALTMKPMLHLKR
jgi:quinol monooxygenase YgiN